MDPFLLPRAALSIALFGLALWRRLLGSKTVPVLASLTAVTTVIVVVIEGCDLA